jgi:hypothetical protein
LGQVSTLRYRDLASWPAGAQDVAEIHSRRLCRDTTSLFKQMWLPALKSVARTSGTICASTAKHHGDFDDDKATVLSTLARVLDRKTKAAPSLSFERSDQGNRAVRRKIDQMQDHALTR